MAAMLKMPPELASLHMDVAPPRGVATSQPEAVAAKAEGRCVVSWNHYSPFPNPNQAAVDAADAAAEAFFAKRESHWTVETEVGRQVVATFECRDEAKAAIPVIGKTSEYQGRRLVIGRMPFFKKGGAT